MRGKKKAKAKAPGSGNTPITGQVEADKRDRRIVAEVMDLADPLCEAEGLELVCVEYQREARGRVLRLYIDKPGGILLDDCASVSRQLSDLLDVTFSESGAYNLEVSSPGPDRPLGRKRDFIKYQGCKAEIRIFQPIGKKKRFKGVLGEMTDNGITLQTGAETVVIPLDHIVRARLVENHGENRC